MPPEPFDLSQKEKEASDLARQEQEMNELKIEIVTTQNPAVEVARLEYTFAERRYQVESQQMERRNTYETQILDLIAKQIEKNRELLQLIYTMDTESTVTSDHSAPATPESQSTAHASPLPANTQIITPHVTLQEVSLSNMPVGQDSIPQYISTPVPTSVSKTSPEILKSQRTLTGIEAGSYIMPSSDPAPVIDTDPGHSGIPVPTTSSQPAESRHSSVKQTSSPAGSRKINSPPYSKSVDTQTPIPPTHQCSQTE